MDGLPLSKEVWDRLPPEARSAIEGLLVQVAYWRGRAKSLERQPRPAPAPVEPFWPDDPPEREPFMANEPAAQPEVWSIRRLLEWTEGYLRQKGIENPRLEAQLLLAHTLGCSRTELYMRADEPIAEEPRKKFKELIRRRTEGCPVAYLVGQREFHLLSFEVSPAVLIPRPETETLLEECLRLIKGAEAPRVLDVGTGSGCIAISVAHKNKAARVTAIDVSPEALTVAKRNAEKHGLAERVRFLEGDLFAPVPAGERFDVIVSNPPYVGQDEFPALAKDVRDHEPRLALDGGPDGLAVYRRLIAEAPAYLEPGGWLLVEIGATQEAAVRGLFEQNGLAVERTLKDLAGHPRVMVGRKPA